MPIPEEEQEAHRIETIAAGLSYECGLGVGEWESFLTPKDVKRLIELGEQGYGTWGNEPKTLARMKQILMEPTDD